ncbi:GIY-YIG nuclease family protein [Thermomonas sp.]|uniref:GIY-YIG nuclease family protein n=1 Tax=Thermomonas sp. TaxID=1971895 RepID=UPI00391DACE7
MRRGYAAPVRPWHLYLLRCRDGSLYAGIATDVERRFRQHNAGKGAKYTRAHPPDCILASRAYPDRGSALRAEWAIKQLPRQRKLAWLLAGGHTSPQPRTGLPSRTSQAAGPPECPLAAPSAS